MKEIREIVAAYRTAVNKGQQVALATVVHVEGSSYRRPGARMLITEHGELTGAISGGCLEGDALRKAQYVMTRKEAMLVTYDTMDDDDAKFGVGLGCNGIIQVLIEPLLPGALVHPLHLLEQLLMKRQKAVLVTLFSLENKQEKQPGTCVLLKEDGSLSGTFPFFSDRLLDDATSVLNDDRHSFRNYSTGEKQVTAFFELVLPPVSLVIAGAGNDIIPLVEMARVLGWDTTLADGRTQLAKQERFAPGCQVIVAKPEQVLQQVIIDERTIFLLMTHNYNYDFALLKELLKHSVAYIGILGPKKKWERMLEDLQAEKIVLTDAQQYIIHTPVGLDIGAETPEEIALSILAEVKAVLSSKPGRFLRSNPDTIHPRAQTTITTVRLPKTD